MKRRKIVIIGPGLIGGSLGLAIRKKFKNWEVLGLGRSQAKINLAKKKGAIHSGSIDARKVLPQADMIFICTPVSSIFHWLTQAERLARPGTLVTDVGSTKREIVAWAEKKKFRKIRFVGSHPMAGSHQTGIQAARADLFDGSLTFVTATPKTEDSALKEFVRFWKRLSARVEVIDPVRHDQIVAGISHFPHAVASLLVKTVPSGFLPYAASGFRDTTRIAQGDPMLWLDIFFTNRDFLLKNLREFSKKTQELIRDLDSRDRAGILRFLAQSSESRKRIPAAIS